MGSTQRTLGLICAGIALAQWQPQLPPLLLAVALFALSLAALSILLLRRAPAPALWLLPLALLLGWSYASARAELRLRDHLPTAWEGRDISLSGRIDGLPQRGELGWRFAFRVEAAHTAGARVPGRILLGWYPAQSGELAGEPLPELHAGERWLLTVRLSRPHGTVNEHGFVAETWLLENDLRARGSVRNDEPNRLLERGGGRWVDHINRWRDHARTRMRLALAEHQHAGALIALAVGDQQAIDSDAWDLFNLTAVSHLLSISGSHVTLFATACGWLLFNLWRRSPALLRIATAQQAVSLLVVLLAFAYAFMAGFDRPAQRTCYMLLVGALALLMRRQLAPGLVFCWALTLVLVLDPWSVLALGFWFSFTAVAALIYVTHNRPPVRWWQRLLWAQAAVTLALAPLTVLFFQQVSLVGPLANALAIPLISGLITPLVLVYQLLPIDGLLYIAHTLIAALVVFLEWLAQSPLAQWTQPAAPLWSIAAAFIGVAWLLAPRGWPHRGLGTLWCLPMLWPAPDRPAAGDFRLTLLDVGQGSAVLIETARHQLLYDTGPAWRGGSDAGQQIIAPYLRAVGIERLDALIVSHDDLDHSGGATALLQRIPTRQLWSSAGPASALAQALPASAPPLQPCHDGQRWTWGGVRFQHLHPPPDAADHRLDDNDRSCVLKISTDSHQLLLTGDISTRQEHALIARHGPAALRANLFLAPHHGSRSSSSPAFIDAVAPGHVLINAGHRNRYGHPAPDVLARYRERGIHILRSDQLGGIRIDTAHDGLRVRGARAQLGRYWLQARVDD